MGVVICKIHGRGGIVETCSHVAKRLDERKSPNGRRLIIANHFLVCDDCFNSLGFERFMSLSGLPVDELLNVDHSTVAAFEAAYNAIEDRRIFCQKCIEEIEADGEPVPGQH